MFLRSPQFNRHGREGGHPRHISKVAGRESGTCMKPMIYSFFNVQLPIAVVGGRLRGHDEKFEEYAFGNGDGKWSTCFCAMP